MCTVGCLSASMPVSTGWQIFIGVRTKNIYSYCSMSLRGHWSKGQELVQIMVVVALEKRQECHLRSHWTRNDSIAISQEESKACNGGFSISQGDIQEAEKGKGSRFDKQEGTDVFRQMMPQFHNMGSKQSTPGAKETVFLGMAQSPH